jgi:radical SAM protein with 4Fe4S-binding SPASM domain
MEPGRSRLLERRSDLSPDLKLATLAAPLDVYWSLTQGCNLECNFCLTRSAPGATTRDLTPAQRDLVLQMILDAGVLRVVLTGGEPFTVPGILKLLQRLRAASIGVKVTTNGTLLRPPLLTHLADLGVRLQFSIESNDTLVNDRLMGGRGTRDRILDGIRRSRKVGLPCEVKLTMQRANVRDLGPLYDALRDLGVSKIDVSEVSPLGRAVDNWTQLECSLEDLEFASREAAEARERGCPVFFGAARLQNIQSGTPALCSLGSARPRTILIDEFGDVRPCAAIESAGWKNSILEHGLIGAWDRLTELGQFRDPSALEGECRGCELVEECKGGCRGLAMGAWGHSRGPDPYCPKLGAREGRPAYGRKIDPVWMVFPDGTEVGG